MMRFKSRIFSGLLILRKPLKSVKTYGSLKNPMIFDNFCKNQEIVRQYNCLLIR